MSGDSDRWLNGTQTLDRPVHQCGCFLCLSLQFTLNSQLSGRTESKPERERVQFVVRYSNMVFFFRSATLVDGKQTMGVLLTYTISFTL